MSDQLFAEVARPTVRVGNKSWKTIPLSVAAHVVALGTLIVVPLLATGMVPTPQSVIASVAIPPPPPPPPAPMPPRAPQPVQPINPNAAPPAEPDRISPEPEVLPVSMPGLPVAPGGIPGVGTLGVPGGTSFTAPPPPPPAAPPQQPVRPGGQIKEPSKIRDVKPIYPQIAITAKVEGMVIIEATIGKDGSVVDAKVLRSIALLDQAALDAVRQWKFTPTLLNGIPVPVLMTVTVNFSLR
jgi:protein TonB